MSFFWCIGTMYIRINCHHRLRIISALNSAISFLGSSLGLIATIRFIYCWEVLWLYKIDDARLFYGVSASSAQSPLCFLLCDWEELCGMCLFFVVMVAFVVADCSIAEERRVPATVQTSAGGSKWLEVFKPVIFRFAKCSLCQ